MFQFIKKYFFAAPTFLTSVNLLNATPLSCISLKIRSVKQNPKLSMLMEMKLCFFHLILKQVNVVVVVIILTIRKQKLRYRKFKC